MLLYRHGLRGLHSLQTLVPSLLRHEVETALEKLGLAWDRSYAWDMFLIMMVRPNKTESLWSYYGLCCMAVVDIYLLFYF